MPRIVPLQLLKCLKVLLDDNGGILSIGEVKRIAGLMNRYSKKLVSKCIYVQILKVTKTELLGEFMGVGGWSLVYNWLNDAIRAMNWPLVQEILELLLLCPVDVDRLKINSAPKLVKGLCRDGGNEGVRILAKRLVEQWLKVVTENTSSAQLENVQQTPQTMVTATPPINVTVTPLSQSTPVIRQEPKVLATAGASFKVKPTVVVRHPTKQAAQEEDPLADVADTPPEPSTYAPTQAQKKASEAGLVFKLVYKDGQQVLAKVPPKSVQVGKTVREEEEKSESIVENVATDGGEVEVETEGNGDEDADAEADANAEAEAEEQEPEQEPEPEAETEVEAEPEAEAEIKDCEAEEETDSQAVSNVIEEEEDTRTSLDKPEKESESSADDETQTMPDNNKAEPVEQTISNRKRSIDADSDKSTKEERRSSKDSKESKSKNKSKDKDKEKEKEKDKEQKLDKEKDKDRKSSSSSSSHKSSSHKSKSSSSSKSKSSSSNSHRSSSDKHRSDKDKDKDRSTSSSSKDKERKEGSSSSSGSSKHRSSTTSSSSKSSTSTSSKEKYRDKDKEKSFSSTASASSSSSTHKKEKEKEKEREKDKEKEKEKEKEREKETQAEKDKETIAKLAPPSIDKLGRIPKKPKDETESAGDTTKPTSITIPSKKASMSIEIRRDSEKAKTVKTYKSQFRSHGLTEEAPPPPSRKGLKKPTSTTSAPGTVIPTSLPSSLKRPSPPPSSTAADSPTLKKSKLDINNLTVANEKPGAIKLIAPKKIQTLVETNIFSDALAAATGPKKVTKRKRATTPAPGKEGEPGTPTSPDAQKLAPLKFYQDTLDEQTKGDDKSDKENDAKDHKNKSEDSDGADKGGNSTEDDDDIPLKKVKEDIEQKVLREQKAADENANNTENSVASSDTSSTATPTATGTSDTTANAVGGSVDITGSSDADEDAAAAPKDANANQIKAPEEEEDPRKPPGPGCGPNGPPGVLMIHRRKGPKKKLTWRPQEQLEQIRYFELDENERVNVTKPQSFMDMKNLERYSERDAINIARRGFTHEDNMRPQTEWRQPLIEVDGVPPHPNGSQSKQRKVQAERELTTLRALYFSHSMIPDSPTEAELEPHFSYDIPVIPLEDITGNPDAVSDYTNMPWPEPKGSPKFTESNHSNNAAAAAAAGKLTNAQVNALTVNNVNAYPGFMPPQYPGAPTNNMLAAQMQMPRPVPAVGAAAGQLPPGWQGGNFNGALNMGAAMSASAVAQQTLLGPFGPPAVNAAQWQIHASGAQYAPAPNVFNSAPNFGPMGMMAARAMPNMPPAANAFERNNERNERMSNSNHHNSNNNSSSNSNQSRSNSGGGGGGWRTGSSFQDSSSGGGGGGGGWRSGGGGGHNRSGGGGGNRDNNNGVCKAFMRGHCRLGKSCKYVHPKSKRI